MLRNTSQRYVARVATLLILLFVSVAAGRSGVYAQVSAPTKQLQRRDAERALLISLDGLDVRYLQQADHYKLRIPTLRRLMRQGVAAQGVIAVYPTLTYPNHTSLVTGAHPARHGIFGNSLFEPPEVPQTRGAHWFARDIRVDTLWDAASRSRLTVGMVSWPVAGGAGDYNVPEIWQPGGTLEESRALVAQYARPRGLVAEVERRIPDIYRNVTRDEGDDARTRFAEYIIREKRPDLMLVHLYDFDHYQHDHGPFTPEALASLEKTDGYLARLLAAAEQAGTLAQTAVFITSDHGFLPVSKQFHPGVLLERAGLVKVREEKDAQNQTRTVVTGWRALPYVTGGACAIILRDADDRDALSKLRLIFEPFTANGKGLLRVLDEEEIRALGSNVRAGLMLEGAEGFTFGSNYTGEIVTESRTRGMHGYLPTRPDYRASFIAAGAGVGRRGRLDEVRMIDIGPTIARALGFVLRDAEGQAMSLK